MRRWGVITENFNDGPYSIDVDRMWKLYYDRRRTENYTNKNFFDVEHAEATLMPKVTNIDIHWERAAADAKGYADNMTETTCQKLSSRQITTAMCLRQHLKAEYGSLESARRRFTQQIQDNGKANSAALASNIKGWETAITGARYTRNASTAILAVGAVVLTGGAASAAFTGVSAANAGAAALGVTAVGSGLTGVGKAQDSERHLTTSQAVGVAVVAGSVDFITTVLTGNIAKGANLAWKGKAIVGLFVRVPTKTCTSIMMAEMTRRPDEKAESLGAHAWKATVESAIEVGAEGLGDKIVKIGPVKRFIERMAVAGTSVLKHSAEEMGEFLKEGVAKGASMAGESGSTAAVETAASLAEKGAPKERLPDAAVIQPIHGGAALEPVILNAILSPLFSRA